MTKLWYLILSISIWKTLERERERERVESRIESLDNFVTRNLKNITEHLNENENLIEI